MVPHLLLFSCVIIHMSTALGKSSHETKKTDQPHHTGRETKLNPKKNPQKNSSQPKQ